MDSSFFHGWTTFYWAWWIAWSPFVGMFIARISKGRTVREFIICALIALFFTIWLSSGTLVPYAASLDHPVVDKESGYLFNSDHPHYMGPK